MKDIRRSQGQEDGGRAQPTFDIAVGQLIIRIRSRKQ